MKQRIELSFRAKLLVRSAFLLWLSIVALCCVVGLGHLVPKGGFDLGIVLVQSALIVATFFGIGATIYAAIMAFDDEPTQEPRHD